jgi:hypothetical protein
MGSYSPEKVVVLSEYCSKCGREDFTPQVRVLGDLNSNQAKGEYLESKGRIGHHDGVKHHRATLGITVFTDGKPSIGTFSLRPDQAKFFH